MFYASPPQTSRHRKIGREVNIFSCFLDSVCKKQTELENFLNHKSRAETNNSMVQNRLHSTKFRHKPEKTFDHKITKTQL